MKSKIINLDFNDNIDLIKATVDKLQNQVQHWNIVVMILVVNLVYLCNLNHLF